MLYRIFCTFATIFLVRARINHLIVGTTIQCEGKDAGNYSVYDSITTDDECADTSTEFVWQTVMILNGANNERIVNSRQSLAFLSAPAGAYQQLESISLVTGGNLEGKFVYTKILSTRFAFMKKCSSVLGYSYTTSKRKMFMISDELDINVLISPTGAYKSFEKSATTICTAQEYIV